MFKLIQTGREGGDCTAPYDVELDKEYTVREFITEVLINRPNEWGDIYYCEGVKIRLVDDPHCEYRYGILLTTLPEEILDKKVIYVTAHGGWSSMDYFIR